MKIDSSLLIALGGNALIKKGQTGTINEQFENLKRPLSDIARLSKDQKIIITHGNGPQVGNLLLQQECCDSLPRLPLEILVAQTEGQIGYMIESTLDGELMHQGVDYTPMVTLITYVVVDRNDPAFSNPTKPIGPVYQPDQVTALPFPVMETAKGPRRVVASPEPITIVEKREIRQLMELGFIVICCGGGGIPVVREERAFAGVDAVIDKDLVSARLALEAGIETFIIATDVPGVAMDFGTPNQRFLEELSCDKAKALLKDGQLGVGSMGPKVEAATRFVSQSGRRAIICQVDQIAAAFEGQAGTDIIP